MRHAIRLRLIATLILLAASTNHAPSQEVSDLARCRFSASLEAVTRACHSVIEAGAETPENLARAYIGRAGRRLVTRADGRIRIENDIDRAIADFSEAIRLAPAMAHAYAARADAWREKGDFESAVADYGEAIRHGQNDMAIAALRERRGLLFRDNGQFERAIADFSAVIAAQPPHRQARAILQRGVAYRGMHDFDRALADFSEVIELAWDRPLALAHRGWVHLLRGDLRKADDDFHSALGRAQHRGKLTIALYRRGLLKRQAGDETGARADILAAAAIDDELVRQLDMIGMAMLKDDPARVHGEVQAALGVIFDRVPIALTLYGRGTMRMRSGDTEGGNADLAAARIVDRRTVEEIERFGVK